jgi:hypothetical protein
MAVFLLAVGLLDTFEDISVQILQDSPCRLVLPLLWLRLVLLLSLSKATAAGLFKHSSATSEKPHFVACSYPCTYLPL